jgi:hAT family C-terminal dimerisation region
MLATSGDKAGNRTNGSEQVRDESKVAISRRQNTSLARLTCNLPGAQNNGDTVITDDSAMEGSCLRAGPESLPSAVSRGHAGPGAISDDPVNNQSPVLGHAVVGSGHGSDSLFKPTSNSNIPFGDHISDQNLFTEAGTVAEDNDDSRTGVTATQMSKHCEAHDTARKRPSLSMLPRRNSSVSEAFDSKPPSCPSVRNSVRTQAMMRARNRRTSVVSSERVDSQFSRETPVALHAATFHHVAVGAMGTNEPGPNYQSEHALLSSNHPLQHQLHPKYPLSRMVSSYSAPSQTPPDQGLSRNDDLGSHLDRNDPQPDPFPNVLASDSDDCVALVQYLLTDGVAVSHADPAPVSGCQNPDSHCGDLPTDAKMRTRAVPSLVRATRDLVSRRLGDIRGCALVVSDVAAFKVVMCLWLTSTFESRSVCLDVIEASKFVGATSMEAFLARVASIAQSWGVLPVTRAVLSVQPERLHVVSATAEKFYFEPEGVHSSHAELFGLVDIPEGTVGTSPTGLQDQSPSIPISLSLNCAVVALERILQTEVFSSPSLLDIFQLIRVAICTVRTEPNLYANNRVVAGLEAKPPLIVDEDTEVSMWTAHAMLERFVEQRDAIDRSLEDMSASASIACIDLGIICKILDVLGVFIEGVRILNSGSGESRRPTGASIAVTIPVIKGLKRALVSRIHDLCDTSVLFRVLKRLHAAVDVEFPDLETRNIYAIATVVDPRFKSQVFDSLEAGKAAELALRSACMRICYPSSHVSLGYGKAESSLETDRKFPNSGIATYCDSKGGLYGEAELHVANAIRMYLSEPVSEFSVDIGEYWRSNSTRWPSLAHVASLYLCMPASTRIVLPTAGVTSGHRDGGFLNDSDANQLLFIRQNLLAGVGFKT